MTTRLARIALAMALTVPVLSAQTPAPVDTSKLGPQIGAVVPLFEGVDQFGKTRSLASVFGPKGAMLVFFRSADW